MRLLSRTSERTRWMGMLGASFGVGFVLGPLVAFFLPRLTIGPVPATTLEGY